MFILKFWSKLRIVHCPFSYTAIAMIHAQSHFNILFRPGGGRLPVIWQWLSVMQYLYPIKFFGHYCHIEFKRVSYSTEPCQFFVSSSDVSLM
jgi:hypothetical protein